MTTSILFATYQIRKNHPIQHSSKVRGGAYTEFFDAFDVNDSIECKDVKEFLRMSRAASLYGRKFGKKFSSNSKTREVGRIA